MVFIPQVIYSQTDNGIEMSTEVIAGSNISPANENVLASKLDNLLASNGFVKGINSQFVLQSSLDEIQNQQVGGSSGNIMMYEVSVSTKIINKADQNVFAQTSQVIKGMGSNKTTAINSALKKINFNTDYFNSFLAKGKLKIIDYYSQNCNRVIEEANMLEKTDQYENALNKLVGVPPSASKCYKTAMNKALAVYQKKINFDCKVNLSQAKLAWSANPSWNTAQEIQSLLGNVNPQSPCYKEVNTFSNSVSARIKELDGRDWKIQYETEVGLEKDRIQAIKEIGKAYGTGQPKQVIHNNKVKL